jgi:hypothetical protein
MGTLWKETLMHAERTPMKRHCNMATGGKARGAPGSHRLSIVEPSAPLASEEHSDDHIRSVIMVPDVLELDMSGRPGASNQVTTDVQPALARAA